MRDAGTEPARDEEQVGISVARLDGALRGVEVDPLLEPVVPTAGPVPRPDDDPIALVLSGLLAGAVFAQPYPSNPTSRTSTARSPSIVSL